MNTTMSNDRGMMMGTGNPGMSMPANMGTMGMSMPMGMNMGTGMNPMMMPRCTMTFEKLPNGMKVTCMCDDKMSAAMMQNLCMMMPNGMMSCCCMMNGMMCCCCNMTMGTTTIQMMEMGCTMMCISGDSMAQKMMHACCDCMTAMMMPGCTMVICMNNMPVGCCIC